MHAVHYKKSSIDFLLSDAKVEECLIIEPKTLPKTSNPKLKKLFRPKNPQFSLKILQQPLHAKVTPRPPCRFPPFSEHRPVHPPPVLQLKLNDFSPKTDPLISQMTDEYIDVITNRSDPRSIERAQELKILRRLKENRIPSWAHYSTFFVIARLQTQTTASAGTGNGAGTGAVTFEDVKPNEDLLVGSKVCSGMSLSLRTASPSNSYLSKSLPKEQQRSSNYAISFVFSDLAVTRTGKFRLKFDLFEVHKGKIQWRNMTFSDTFQVFTPKKFPGSSPSSPLTAFLFKNGARIRQRKRPFVKKETEEQSESLTNPLSSTSIHYSSSFGQENSFKHHHHHHQPLNSLDSQLPFKRTKLSTPTNSIASMSSISSSDFSRLNSNNRPHSTIFGPPLQPTTNAQYQAGAGYVIHPIQPVNQYFSPQAQPQPSQPQHQQPQPPQNTASAPPQSQPNQPQQPPPQPLLHSTQHRPQPPPPPPSSAPPQPQPQHTTPQQQDSVFDQYRMGTPTYSPVSVGYYQQSQAQPHQSQAQPQQTPTYPQVLATPSHTHLFPQSSHSAHPLRTPASQTQFPIPQPPFSSQSLSHQPPPPPPVLNQIQPQLSNQVPVPSQPSASPHLPLLPSFDTLSNSSRSALQSSSRNSK